MIFFFNVVIRFLRYVYKLVWNTKNLGIVFRGVFVIFLVPASHFTHNHLVWCFNNFLSARFLFYTLSLMMVWVYCEPISLTSLGKVVGGDWIIFLVPEGYFTHFHLGWSECKVNFFLLNMWSFSYIGKGFKKQRKVWPLSILASPPPCCDPSWVIFFYSITFGKHCNIV